MGCDVYGDEVGDVGSDIDQDVFCDDNGDFICDNTIKSSVQPSCCVDCAVDWDADLYRLSCNGRLLPVSSSLVAGRPWSASARTMRDSDVTFRAASTPPLAPQTFTLKSSLTLNFNLLSLSHLFLHRP